MVAVSCAAPAFCMALTWAGDAYQGCDCQPAAAGRSADGPEDRPARSADHNVQAGTGPAQLAWQIARSRTPLGGERDARTQRR